MDILKTPAFLERYLDANQWYRPSANIQSTNSNNGGNQGGNNNNSNNNSGFRNRWDNNNQGGGGFQAFSGRGNTWG